MSARGFLEGRNIFNVILLLFVIVVSAFFIVIPWFRADNLFVDSEYSGVIHAIEYREGDRGIPSILIGSQWKSLSVDETKIKQHIQIGDSIVKRTGSEEIELYKKVRGKYRLKGRY
jgi:hypothetical protein